MCLAVFDESGDAGVRKLCLEKHKPSPYFSVAAVVFPEMEQAGGCEKRIISLREELSLSPNYEFHFTSAGKRGRTEFLKAVKEFDFLYAVTTIDKRELTGNAWNKKSYLFHHAARMSLDAIKAHLVGARVFIDKSGDKRFDREICSFLKKHAGLHEKKPRIAAASAYDSKKHNLVQLVDMVCGAVVRCYREGEAADSSFREIIKSRELHVQMWPKTKEATGTG
jgi:hypothetical protein